MAKPSIVSFKFTLRILSFLMLLASFVYFLPQYTLAPFANLLVVDQEPSPSDAIVILLGSSQPDRVLKAYQLYSSGVAPRIAYGSGFVDKTTQAQVPPQLVWLRNSDLYTKALESLSVPARDIEIISGEEAYDTATELKVIADYAKSANWKKIILVSTASHTRRIDMIWRRLGAGIAHEVVAAPLPELQQWWKSGRMRREMGYHYAALIKELASATKHWIRNQTAHYLKK